MICFYKVKYIILRRSHSGERSCLGRMIFLMLATPNYIFIFFFDFPKQWVYMVVFPWKILSTIREAITFIGCFHTCFLFYNKPSKWLSSKSFLDFGFGILGFWGVLEKKVFLKISQNSQENTCDRVSFSIKLQNTSGKLLLQSFFRSFLFLSSWGWTG